MNFATRRIGRTDLRVPTLGFGGAPLGGLFAAVDESDALSTLQQAFAGGMTYVDTAPFYGFGLSERRVGDVLRGQDYVLSTKVGRLLTPGAMDDPGAMGWPAALPFTPDFDYSYDGILRSFEDSLQRLGLDRIDILYVHDIGEETHGAGNARHFGDLTSGGYRALDELRRDGRITAIGLGVNEAAVCLAALDHGDWDVFLLAGRYTLLEQAPLDDLLPACAARGVSIVVGGPFNSGILVGGETWNYGAAPASIIERVTRLKATCARFDVPLPAAALHFPLAHPCVAAVIPGLRTPRELAEAQAWAALTIPAAFWEALKAEDLLHPAAPTPTGNPFLETSR
ncbi:MAG: aldo/keto reductase [Rhodobacteraceae bacterium]|nr:MAG: aldo/keto reductase [Paracoccaceae bacterium]